MIDKQVAPINAITMKYAKEYFRKYPKSRVLYFTTDNLAFTGLEQATDHAKGLEDDLVIPITRKEAMAAITDMITDGWNDYGNEDEQYY